MLFLRLIGAGVFASYIYNNIPRKEVMGMKVLLLIIKLASVLESCLDYIASIIAAVPFKNDIATEI